jgi:hypothetical protein
MWHSQRSSKLARFVAAEALLQVPIEKFWIAATARNSMDCLSASWISARSRNWHNLDSIAYCNCPFHPRHGSSDEQQPKQLEQISKYNAA